MKGSIITFLILVSVLFAKAQDITTYIDKRGEQCFKSKARYQRKVWMEGEKYHVKDYYLSGKLYMDAYCTAVFPLLFEGPCIYYYENGQKQMEGYFNANHATNDWKYWSEDGTPLHLGTAYKIYPVDSSVFDAGNPSNRPSGFVEAEFQGGGQVLSSYMNQMLKYPQEAAWRAISGRMLVSFVVDTTGKVKEVYPLTRLGVEFDEEVKRVLASMPAWTPATLNGNKIKVRKLIAIDFILPPIGSRINR